MERGARLLIRGQSSSLRSLSKVHEERGVRSLMQEQEERSRYVSLLERDRGLREGREEYDLAVNFVTRGSQPSPPGPDKS